MIGTASLRAAGTSAEAIRKHYDLPTEFFRGWLGADLIYSCALWAPGDSLERAQTRKLDFFADQLQVGGRRVLDV
jgi:cyclopropane-fatty-acyl-phospholipid synthase